MHKNAMRRRRKAVGGEGLFFHRRECAGGVAKGDGAGDVPRPKGWESVAETGEGVLFLSSTTEKDTKKNALEGLR